LTEKTTSLTHGVLVVDKPEHITSYDVIRKIKRAAKRVKVGYLGTLDPLATGVLPLLIGEATKLVPFLEAEGKVYEAVICLGIATDTQDRDGKRMRHGNLRECDVSEERLGEILSRFVGTVRQVPPMFSALKQQGTRLYELARRGVEIERTPREVEIFGIEIVEVSLPYVTIRVECSKGTYIRTLAHDVGEALGCGGHLWALRRLRNGPFAAEHALSLDTVMEELQEGVINEHIIPLSEALRDLPLVRIGEKEARSVAQGRAIAWPGGGNSPLGEGTLVRIGCRSGERLVAVGRVTVDGNRVMVKPVRVFHEENVSRRDAHTIRNARNTAQQGRNIDGSRGRENEGIGGRVQTAR